MRPSPVGLRLGACLEPRDLHVPDQSVMPRPDRRGIAVNALGVPGIELQPQIGQTHPVDDVGRQIEVV